VIPIVAQVLVPIGLLIWHGRGAAATISAAALRTALTAAYLVAIAQAGMWLMVPWLVALVYIVVFVVQLPGAVRRTHGLPWWPRARSPRLRLVGLCALTVATMALTAVALASRRPPSDHVVDLDFPLTHGHFVIANGGSKSLTNAHLQTLTAERFRNYRGQSFGVDIVALNGLGMRASSFAAGDPRTYVIFGQPIHAPCSGRVLRSEDGHPDMAPPQPDREHMAGNFVFIDCDGTHVLLGHLQQGTLRVLPGASVTLGDVLGQVGNSGNSNEPHLHIHAQRPAGSDQFLSGDPLPLRLNGRFLTRNDHVVRNP
jgi:hypothetical protein